MASKATLIQDTYGAVVIRVDHLDTDSFRRSVDNAATRARKRAVNRNTVSHVVSCYAFDTTGRKCVSLIAYARSFDECERAIEEGKIAVAR